MPFSIFASPEPEWGPGGRSPRKGLIEWLQDGLILIGFVLLWWLLPLLVTIAEEVPLKSAWLGLGGLILFLVLLGLIVISPWWWNWYVAGPVLAMYLAPVLFGFIADKTKN